MLLSHLHVCCHLRVRRCLVFTDPVRCLVLLDYGGHVGHTLLKRVCCNVVVEYIRTVAVSNCSYLYHDLCSDDLCLVEPAL